VQSGKTSHLLANICWARDKNFHLAIVLTGSISDLGEQTVDRLREKLPENTAFIINSPTDSSLNATILNLLIDKVQKRENSTTVPIPVITLIKSPARLAAVKRMLQELKHNLNLNLKVILLDDEADQASVDATNSSRANTNSEVNLNSDHRIRTTIHSRIKDI
jgi:hypothetical protein